MGMFKQLDTALQELIDQHGAPAVLAAATELLKCKCSKCGNAWAPRGGKLPAQCPACKSIKWRGVK